MTLRQTINQRSKLFWWSIGAGLIILLGVVDNRTGVEFRSSFFYLIPLALISWFTGMRAGIIASFICTTVWLTANLLLGPGFSRPAVAYWNALTICGFYLVIALLLAKLREVLERENASAHTDYLTGALNARAFHQLTRAEIDRARRYNHPFSLAYLDVDDFKAVNDEAGHRAGDKLLQLIVRTIKENIRSTDYVARLGGDEFAVLFPESDYEAVEQMIRRIRSEFLVAGERGRRPITFSIGALTCHHAPATLDEMMTILDRLMYSVKHEGKNSVRHEILSAAVQAASDERKLLDRDQVSEAAGPA